MKRAFRLAAIAGMVAVFGGLIAATPALADRDHDRDYRRDYHHVRRDRDDRRWNWDNDHRWDRDRRDWNRDRDDWRRDRDWQQHRRHGRGDD